MRLTSWLTPAVVVAVLGALAPSADAQMLIPPNSGMFGGSGFGIGRTYSGSWGGTYAAPAYSGYTNGYRPNQSLVGYGGYATPRYTYTTPRYTYSAPRYTYATPRYTYATPANNGYYTTTYGVPYYSQPASPTRYQPASPTPYRQGDPHWNNPYPSQGYNYGYSQPGVGVRAPVGGVYYAR